MKKPLIFLSALLLTLPVLAGCTGETVSEPQQAESAAETAAPKERAIMTMGDLIEYVASYKNATQSLGYTFYYYINNLYKNDNIKVLQINGIAPDNENLLDHSYPFSSGYYAVTRKDGDKKAEEIKEFLLSAEGQEIIQLAGYCPVG